jgi:hypothetical protein
VVIYQQPPANSSDVAILRATSHSAFSPGEALAIYVPPAPIP